MKLMMNLDLILKFEINSKTKCEICVPRKPFKPIERKIKLLELIDRDICDLNNIITRDAKDILLILWMIENFITDDFSKYCFIYLINSKNDYMINLK